MEIPEGFLQSLNPYHLSECYATQGEGILHFDKRIEALAYYSDRGTMSEGPALIVSDGMANYVIQGHHRLMAAILQEENMLSWVIDSEEDVRYLNDILANPKLRPDEWNYERKHIPIHTPNFSTVLDDVDNLATGYTLGNLLDEYLELIE